jgi:sec-independent protein translocase protein TatA
VFGFQEGLIILAIVVIIMGVGRLPQIGDALGRSLLNFRRSVRGEDEIDVTPPKQVDAGEDEAPPKD